jgi:hypothetical protein
LPRKEQLDAFEPSWPSSELTSGKSGHVLHSERLAERVRHFYELQLARSESRLNGTCISEAEAASRKGSLAALSIE